MYSVNKAHVLALAGLKNYEVRRDLAYARAAVPPLLEDFASRGENFKSRMLIVFGGLPGTGKTTVAEALAQELNAVHLRVDTIEQALRSSAVLKTDVGPAGYVVDYRLAEDWETVAELLARLGFTESP